jgi:hypothetical protein
MATATLTETTRDSDVIDVATLAAMARRGGVLSPESIAGHLALTFPTLRNADGVCPFNADRLDAWTRSGAATNASRQAAAFVLNVYNHDHKWKCGPFNLGLAFGVWDQHHRAAFQAWAMNPFTL